MSGGPLDLVQSLDVTLGTLGSYCHPLWLAWSRPSSVLEHCIIQHPGYQPQAATKDLKCGLSKLSCPASLKDASFQRL